jgi:Zn-dependent protease with chaperone function
VQQANGTYRYAGEETIVTLVLQQHQLLIDLGANRQVLWYYDQIMKVDGATFAYPGPTQQFLQVHNRSFSEILTERMQKQVSSVTKSRGSTLLKVLGIFLLIALAFYFFALPRLAAGMADRVSVSYEKQLGDQLYQSIKPGFDIDQQKTAYLNDFFNQLKFHTSYPITITVVKSDIPNAFAIPGGHIVVYDRILAGMNSYEELAALLAHEVTHIEKRHSLKSMFRQLSTRLFFTLLLGDIDVVGSILLSNADNLKQLSYSRSLETEADTYGVSLLAGQNISCEGFIQLFRLLQKETGNTSEQEWFSSHPDIEKRMANIKSLTACPKSTVSNPVLQMLFTRLHKNQ